MHTIRPAVPKDVGAILNLIRELAIFEKLEHEMVATDADLTETLFGQQPTAHALVSESGDELSGMAIYFFSYSTFLGRPSLYLEDLYVRPKFRGSGLGMGFMKKLAKIALDRRCGRFEWSVLDWNKEAIKFYESLGAKPRPGWTVYRMFEDKIRALVSRI